MQSEILKPVVVLIAWTLVVLVLLIAKRMPALKKAGIDVTRISGSRPHQLDSILQEKTQWPAHNYMHLVEQPTLFYAIALLLAVIGQGNGVNATIAWAYVGLRILHSLVQVTSNRILYRFTLFALASLSLIALTLHAAMAVFHLHG